jgi:hypothetical protein
MSSALHLALIFLLQASIALGRPMQFELLPYEPVANASAIVVSGQARFTVLTDSVIRCEFSTNGKFEDRATVAVVNRLLPVPLIQHESKRDSTAHFDEFASIDVHVGHGVFVVDAANFVAQKIVFAVVLQRQWRAVGSESVGHDSIVGFARCQYVELLVLDWSKGQWRESALRMGAHLARWLGCCGRLCQLGSRSERLVAVAQYRPDRFLLLWSRSQLQAGDFRLFAHWRQAGDGAALRRRHRVDALVRSRQSWRRRRCRSLQGLADAARHFHSRHGLAQQARLGRLLV